MKFISKSTEKPWCEGAQPLSEIGVFTPEEFTGGEVGMSPEAIKGATRILEQGSQQIHLLDSASDLSKYRLLVLPDCIPVSAEFARKLAEYIEGGGSLIATFASGMDETRTRFTTGLFGVTASELGPRDLNGNLVCGKPYNGTMTTVNTFSRRAQSDAVCRKPNTPCIEKGWPFRQMLMQKS